MPSCQSLGSGAQGPALAIQLSHGKTRTPILREKALGAREGSLRPETTEGGTRRQRRKAKGHRLREEAPPSSLGRAGLRCAAIVRGGPRLVPTGGGRSLLVVEEAGPVMLCGGHKQRSHTARIAGADVEGG